MDAQTCWRIILALTATGNSSTKRFPNLAVIVSFLFSFPSSNAAAERLFSVLKLKKNSPERSIEQGFRWIGNDRRHDKKEDATADSIIIRECLVNRVIAIRQTRLPLMEIIKVNYSNRVSCHPFQTCCSCIIIMQKYRKPAANEHFLPSTMQFTLSLSTTINFV